MKQVELKIKMEIINHKTGMSPEKEKNIIIQNKMKKNSSSIEEHPDKIT